MIRFEDAGGRSRTLRIREVRPPVIRAESLQSLYIAAGLKLAWYRGGKLRGRGTVGELPIQPADLFLSPGDRLLLSADGKGIGSNDHVIVCPEPEVLSHIQVGERVLLADGKLGSIVESVDRDGLHCRIVSARKVPTRLRSGKGIAFPDSNVPSAVLGPHDELAFAFALEHADGTEASFVNGGQDVRLLIEKVRGSTKPAVSTPLTTSADARGEMIR